MLHESCYKFCSILTASMQVKHLSCSRKARLRSSDDGMSFFAGYIRSVGLADRRRVLWSANILGYKRMIDRGCGLGRYGSNLVDKTISSIMIFFWNTMCITVSHFLSKMAPASEVREGVFPLRISSFPSALLATLNICGPSTVFEPVTFIIRSVIWSVRSGGYSCNSILSDPYWALDPLTWR